MKKVGIQTPWDIAPALLALLLYGNFVLFFILLFAAMGVLFLYPALPVVTAILLLVSITAHLATRKRSCKLWRRLLLGGIAANFFVVAFYVAAFVLMAAAWG